jgi:hypothetical protein
MQTNLLLLFLCFVQYCCGQVSFSPWTADRLGDRTTPNHGIFSGIGNCTISAFDSTVLNFYNPASYGSLSKGMPLYSICLNGRYLQMSDAMGKSRNVSIVPDHFAMGFGLNKHFGFAFGLRPFAQSAYEVTERSRVGTDSLKYVYKGSGGSQEVFLGLSLNLLQLKSTFLSLGVNAGYIFGSTLKERQSYLILGNATSGGIGIDQNELRIKSLHYEFAVNLKQKISSNQTVTLSSLIEPKQDFKAQENYFLYGPGLNKIILLNSKTGVHTSIKAAGKFRFGMAYSILFKDLRKNNSQRNSELTFHVNYTYSHMLKIDSTMLTLNQPKGWNFGIQYTPETAFQNNSSNLNFFEKIHYRAGYYQLYLPYRSNNQEVIDKGFTFGIGLPITAFKTLSSINIAFLTGKRSNFSESGYQERYLGVSLGVMLSPSNFDKWFVKRKLD